MLFRSIKRKEKKKVNYSFFKEPFFILCTLTLFFYLCAEQGVIGWLVTYFKDTGLVSGTWAQILASVLWIMVLIGRLITAWLSTKVDRTKLFMGMGIGFVFFFLLLIFTRTPSLIIIGIMCFGLSMAGIYPTTVSFAGGIINKYDMAWSFMLTFAGLGSIIMPSIIGKIAEVAGIEVGMSSIVMVVFIDLILIFTLGIYRSKIEN